jgi:hypothetical protein
MDYRPTWEKEQLREEMNQLEDAVAGLEDNYRLVDRLGEGARVPSLRRRCSGADRATPNDAQAPSRPSTKQSTSSTPSTTTRSGSARPACRPRRTRGQPPQPGASEDPRSTSPSSESTSPRARPGSRTRSRSWRTCGACGSLENEAACAQRADRANPLGSTEAALTSHNSSPPSVTRTRSSPSCRFTATTTSGCVRVLCRATGSPANAGRTTDVALSFASLPQNYYRQMSTDNLKCYLRDMFRALRATHARGIIHRDVKPANFLYDCKKQFGILVDYGLAQVGYPSR